MEYFHPLTKKYLMPPVRPAKILSMALTLVAGVYAIGFEYPWYGIAGTIYLLAGMVLVPMMLHQVEEKNICSFMGKNYGARSRILVATIGLLYLTVRGGAYFVGLYHIVYAQSMLQSYALLLVIGIVGILVACFQLQAIQKLQIVLFGIAIAIFSMLARGVIFSQGGIVSWYKIAKSFYGSVGGEWHRALPLLLLSNFLVGHVFLEEQHQEHRKKALVLSFCLSIACLGVFFVLMSLDILRLSEMSYSLFFFALLTWHLFLLSQYIYVAGKMLMHGLVPGIEKMPQVKKSIVVSSMLIGWGILASVLGYFCSEGVLSRLSEHLAPAVIALQVVFLATLLGFRPDTRSFYATIGSAVVLYLLATIVGVRAGISIALTIPGSIVGFGIMHYRVHQGFVFVKRGWRETKRLQGYIDVWVDRAQAFKKLLFFPKYMASISRSSVSRYGSRPFTFGLFFCLTHYILPFFMAPFGAEQAYRTMMYLQAIGMLLSIGLLLYPYWGKRMLRYLPLYWHLTLCYCLPFSTMLLYVLSEQTSVWLIHIAIAQLLFARMVGKYSFMLLSIIGTGAALWIGSYIPFASQGVYALGHGGEGLYPLLYTYAMATLVGLIFICRSAREIGQTEDVLKSFCQKIMHKITNAVGLAKSHATILSLCQHSVKVTEEKAKEHLLIEVKPDTYKMMSDSIRLLDEDSSTSQTMLKNIVRSIKMRLRADEFEQYSVAACIKEAVHNYGLHYEQFSSPQLDLEEDFMFWGDNQALMQVFFNLMDNTYVHASPNAKIAICIKGNKIWYRDSGPGISRLDLPYIFDSFYSTSGSIGMGLSYAKKVLKAFRGDILYKEDAEAKGGMHSCFVVTLPKIKKKGKV